MVQAYKCCSLFTLNQRYVVHLPTPLTPFWDHSNSHHVIDKTIKLWKVFERNLKIVHETNLGENYGPLTAPVAKPFKPTKQLTLPKLVVHDTIIAAVPRRIYANGKEDEKDT